MSERIKKTACGLMFFVACLVFPGLVCADTSQEVLVTVGQETITRADMASKTATMPPQIRGRFETKAGRQQLLEQRNTLQQTNSALLRLSPAMSVQRSISRIEQLRQRLATATSNSMSDANHRIALLGRALNSVSPLATLDRGYAIVKSEQTGNVLMTANDVAVGDDIRTHLAHGELIATVKSVLPDD